MLRINSTRLGQQLQPVWRQSVFAIRHESTSAPSSPPSEEKPKASLSQRLGGSGRGKVMESSGQNQDVFASFLAQAQKKQQRPRNANNNNNGQRRPNQGQREAKPGQFDDAKEDNSAKKRPGNKQQQKRPQQQQQQQTSSSSSDNSNSNNKRQGQQKNKRERKPRQSYNASPSISAPTRRATTFIDKDIDWVSLSPLEFTQEETISTDTAEKDQQLEQLKKETDAGDYTSFLSIGQTIQWPANVDTRGLETLISANPSYGLGAKTTFLATVAKASNAGGNATVKK